MDPHHSDSPPARKLGGTNRDLLALTLLSDIWRRIRALGLDPWELAVELRRLEEAACLPDNPRALSLDGIPHAQVQTDGSELYGLVPPSPAHFVLTAGGATQPDFSPEERSGPVDGPGDFLPNPLMARASDVLAPGPAPVAPAPEGAPELPGQRPRPAATPRWDADCRTLFVNRLVVKKFRQRAENQVLILTTFEELGWPQRIDDPLPGKRGMEPKRRLRDVIQSLKRRQKHPLVTFEADGTGTGVLWHWRG
jgi:hypothetical protein